LEGGIGVLLEDGVARRVGVIVGLGEGEDEGVTGGVGRAVGVGVCDGTATGVFEALIQTVVWISLNSSINCCCLIVSS
jgi:hypothetical protein